MGLGLDGVIEAVSAKISTPPDLVRVFLCQALAFPLCSVLKRMPAQAVVAKELFILGSGLFFLLGIFNLLSGVYTLLLSSAITYALATVWSNRWFMPWLNFVICMALMLVTHAKEQFGDGDYVNNLSISGSQMILVIKLTSLAWDVYDGHLAHDTMSDYQRHNSIPPKGPHRLSPLKFLSYVFFFPAILTGPAFGYREYSEWLDLSMFASSPIKGKGLKKVPSSSGMSIFKAFEGLIWAFLYMQTSNYVTADGLNFYEVEPYTSYSFLQKIFSLWYLGAVYRIKYYCAWCIAEAACIHCGLGFQRYDAKYKKIVWNRVRNVNPLKVETGQNAHDMFANWNMNTSRWLRHYVYLRVTPKGQKPGSFATLATFIVSALWHGTRPGYYLTFIMAALLQMFGKVYRKTVRPVFVGTSYKGAYDIFTLLVTQVSFAYIAQPFILLDVKPTLQVWGSVYYFVQVGLAVSWILLVSPLKRHVKRFLDHLHINLVENE